MARAMAKEVVPAILVKERAELLERIRLVMPHVKIMQIDVMDGQFVPNTTVSDVANLPDGPEYEYHWMVEKPWERIAEIKKPAIHLVHVETVNSPGEWELVKKAVAKNGGKLGLAANPETYLDRVYPHAAEITMILIMTVKPGFDGQKYMYGMEKKIREARTAFPELDIEVDGGINLETIASAAKAGANRFAAASAVFAQKDAGKAIISLKKTAEGA